MHIVADTPAALMRKESEKIDNFHAGCMDNVHDLTNRVHKLEIENNILKAKCRNYEQESDEVGKALEPIKIWAAQTSESLEKLENDSEATKGKLRQLWLDAYTPSFAFQLPDFLDSTGKSRAVTDASSAGVSPSGPCCKSISSSPDSSMSSSPPRSLATEITESVLARDAWKRKGSSVS